MLLPFGSYEDGQNICTQRLPELYQQCREGWEETGHDQAFVKSYRQVFERHAETRCVYDSVE